MLRRGAKSGMVGRDFSWDASGSLRRGGFEDDMSGSERPKSDPGLREVAAQGSAEAFGGRLGSPTVRPYVPRVAKTFQRLGTHGVPRGTASGAERRRLSLRASRAQ